MSRVAPFCAGVLGISSALSCKPVETPSIHPVVAPAPVAASTTSFEHTIATEAVVYGAGESIVLIGQRRAPEMKLPRAWVAMLDADGALMWEYVSDEGTGFAESVVIDGIGRIHVFGHDFGEGAWLLSLDAGGQRLASSPLELGQLLAMDTNGNTVELWGSLPSNAEPAEHRSMRWVVWDPERASTPSSTFIRYSPVSLLEEPAPEMWVMGPGLVGIESGEYRVEADSSTQEHALVELTIAELEAVPDGDEDEVSATLVPRQTASIEDGALALFLLQMPPSAGHDARLEVALHRAPLDAVAEEQTDLSSWIGQQDAPWQWLWPVLDTSELASLESYRVALEGGRCNFVGLDDDCDLSRVTQVAPSFYKPNDTCWRYFEARSYLPESSKEQFVPRLASWLGMLEPLYFRGQSYGSHDLEDYEVQDSLRDDIFAAAVRHGEAEAVIRYLLQLEDDYATADAMTLLEELDAAQAQPLVQRLIEEFRTETDRCDTVLELLALAQSRPKWTADTADECDVLFVLCAGLQPDLATQIVPASGIVYERTCDSSRVAPTESGLEPCTPERWVDDYVDTQQIVDPRVAATCGSNASHLDQRYTCGASIELDSVTLEFGDGPSGRVLTKVEYFETSGS